MHGKHDDFRVGPELPNLFGSFDSVHDRHADVHQYEVGIEIDGFLNGFFAVGGFTADVPIGRAVEEGFDAFADKFVVVNQKDSNGHHALFGIQN